LTILPLSLSDQTAQKGLCAGSGDGENGKAKTAMPLYEQVFLVRQDVSAAQVETLTDQFKSVVEGNGGSVTKNEYWGVKSLTFRIKKNRKAHFSLMNIDADATAVAEMERQMRLNEDVIRFLTLRVAELEEGPSAMMRSRGGRDRDDRRGGPRDRDRDRDSRPPRSEQRETRSDDGDDKKSSEGKDE
jgi:small subunit ribosomal protein S6